MRRFLISQLTRALDFLKPPESVPENVGMQTTVALIDASASLEPEGEVIADHVERAAFFPDKPSARDYLDFQSYAATLADLIEKTQTPLTVGVFGAWGSGKTTLMGMIENALKARENGAEPKSFMLVHFDAWKYYKEDALWRAMLLRVLDALRSEVKGESELKEIENLEQRLYRAIEWKEKGGLTIDWPKLAKASVGGALKLSFAFMPGASTIVEAVKAAQSAIGKGEVAGDVSAFADAFQRDLIVHHRTQLNNIEQFQDEFGRLVKRHFAKTRLVVFVDDLDRCLPEKALEVLEAIKLFLDVEGCVFVLGIDQEVITRGLEVRYRELIEKSQSPKFSTQYIEKLIQLPFHLPPIESREIGSYLKSLNVDWPDDDCAKVFAEALSPNPRQIKRTINVFMLLWKLAERRRSSLGDNVTPLRLAKVVILQTAYPAVFDHLKSNGLLLKQLELLSRDTVSTDPTLDPFLLEAVKQTSLRTLFKLLPDDASANFADLELEDLTAFFSLARRAPLTSEGLAKESPVKASEATPRSDEVRRAASIERPFQLRPPVRDFVGRAAEISHLVAALRQGAPIGIVTGMPGTGKTELALRIAEVLRLDFPDGQLFVDMKGTSGSPLDPADALSGCIRAFVGRERELPQDVEALGQIYRSQLNDRRVLILLDHAADAAQMRPLIPPRGSVLLITSRNALVLPGMVNISLDQLSPEEAITLFRSISPQVPEEIAAQICLLCGYLPPAVRAAASTLAATPDLDPATYARQLSDEQKRLELLGTEGLNVTLEASFSLSYSGLPDETKRVLRMLSVFPETFDAPAEEVICNDRDHALLSELTRLSLVSFDSKEGRYRLHSLMRLFVQRQLTEVEKEDVGKAHAAHYVEVVKAANADYRQGGNGSIKALSLFDREHDNVNAGFEWSVARSNSSKEAASICSDYARYASQILQLRKPPKTRIRWYSQALDAARYVEDVEAELVHLIGLGGAYRKLGERETALDIYMNAREIAAKSSFPQLKAEILSSLGLEYRDRGEIHKARECFDEQLTISRELGNSRGVSLALVNLGNASLALGRVDEAIKRYEEAIDISRKIADLQAEGLALGNLGRAYIQIKDSDRALEFCRQHLEISRKLGDRLGEATALFNIALASQQKGAVDEARAEASAALEIYEQLESANAERVRKWLAQLEPQLVTHDRGNETT